MVTYGVCGAGGDGLPMLLYIVTQMQVLQSIRATLTHTEVIRQRMLTSCGIRQHTLTYDVTIR